MDWKHPLLSDKLRYAKRKTTKREFNFIPINNDVPEAGDAPEQEHTFTLSPPRWASSPRDTPSVSGLQKKRKLVDISLIEPISGLKVAGSKPGTEQEDPTINLAALRAKEKDVAKEDPALAKALQDLPTAQSAEKGSDSKPKESKTDPVSTAKTRLSRSRGSGKSKSNSENDSEGSAKRKSLRVGQKSSSSSKALKSLRSRSSSQSSGMEEHRVPKTFKLFLYKNYRGPKGSGGSASEGSSSRKKRSKNQDEDEVEELSRRITQKSKKSSGGSVNSADENHLPKRQKVSKRSSDSERRSTEEEDMVMRRRSIDLLSKFEELAASSIQSVHKARRKSGGSEKSSDKSLNKPEKSSDSEKATSRGQTVGKKSSTRSSSSEKSSSRHQAVEKKPTIRTSSSEKSTSRGRSVEKIPTTRSSSSEKSTSRGQSIGKKPTTRSSSSEKSTSRGRAVEKKPTTRSSSSEKSTSRGRAVEKKPTTKSSSSEKSTSRGRAVEKKPTTRSSSSEKSTSRGRAVEKKPTTRSSSSEKSTSRGRSVGKKHATRSSSSEKSTSKGRAVEKKPTTRSSSSEKSTSRGGAVEKKPTTRSSRSEKSTSRGRAVEKKPTTRSSSSEKSTSRGRSIGKKPTTRSSNSQKLVEVTSVRKGQSRKLEKSASPTGRVISRLNDKSEIPPGEATSKHDNVHAIFLGKSNKSISSTGLEKFAAEPADMSSSSEDDLFNPQKPKVSKKQVASKKDANFKKAAKDSKKIITQSSGADLSSDEVFSADTNKFSKQQTSSPDGVKSQSKRATKRKVDSAKSIKEKLKKSLENLPQLRSQQQMDSALDSDSDSEKIFPSAKVSKQSESKMLEKTSYKDKSGEMSEEIPLQNRTVITTFAGLPLLDSESNASDEHREDNQTNKLEESMVNLEEILDPNKVKLKKIYDTSSELKVKLLQPKENEGTRSTYTVTDLDVIWNFLGRSLHMILKETDDSEKRTLLKTMKSSLEEQFLGEIGKQLWLKQMQETLKKKALQVDILTNKLLYLKQRNRQLAQEIYENKEEEIPQREDDILDKFQDICRSFAQFKRN